MSSDINLDQEFAKKVIDAVFEVIDTIIMPYHKNLSTDDIERKADQSLVTVADQKAEEELIKHLTKILPGSVILGEESYAADPSIKDNLSKEDTYCWIIDPIDGTTNFANKRPHFGTIISLVKNNEILAGWIFHAPKKQCYYALKGQGVFNHDHAPVKAPQSNRTKPIGYCAPRYYKDHPYEASAQYIFDTYSGDIQYIYASCMEYIAIIEGRSDFIINSLTYPWDHAAGQLILAELRGDRAGKRVDGRYYDLHEWSFENSPIVTSINPKFEKLLLTELEQNKGKNLKKKPQEKLRP